MLLAYMLDTMAVCCILSVCVYAVHNSVESLVGLCAFVYKPKTEKLIKIIHHVHYDGTKLGEGAGDAKHAGSAENAGAEPSTSTQEATSQDATSHDATSQEATSQEAISTQETITTNETASETADSQAPSDSLRVFSDFKDVSDSPKKALGGDDSASGASTECM